MSRRSKPAALAVPAKPADEAPEATPRTIEGGPTVEPDAYGIYHAANTPVGHRGSRGSRVAFTAAGTTENRAEQLLISQMQTPERHRGAGGLGGQAGGSSYLMASPLPNMSSPGGLYPSPNPVPLFQPSPKRQTGMLSPGAHQHTGFEAMFQSPMHGFNSELQAAADLLRFETPSRQAALDSLISPSPNKHARRILPGSQGRSRASSRAAAFDVAGWRQAEEAAGLAAAGAGDDADFDLVKNLLQSPGPKEVQNLQQEHQRSKLGRSTSSTPGGSPWSASEAAAAAAGGEGAARATAHVRRRALDFSKAEQMHRDLAVLPNLRSRGGKHGSGSGLSGLAYGAAAFGAAGAAAEQHLGSSSRDLDQRQQQDQKQSRFQPDLPLLPLDLSECERHNPSSTTGLTPKDPFTRSPRTKLDDAAAVVAGGAMHALRSLHGGSSEEQQRRALDPVLRSLARLPGGYSASSASKLRAAASAAAAAVSPGSGGKLPVMVPLDNLSAVAAAGAGSDIATQVLQLLQGDTGLQEQDLGLQDVQNLFDDHPSEDEEYRLEQQQADADAAADEADEDQQAAGGSAGKAAASRGRSGSAGRQQRTSSRRAAAAAAAAAAVEQPQPSRRSRRIARSTPDAAEQRDRTASPPPRSSSGNRSRKAARRTAEAASEQQHEEQQQYDQHDRAAAAAMAVDVDQEQEEQQQQLALAAAAAAAIEAAAGAEEEDEEAAAEEGTARTRSRSGSARKSSGKKSSRSQQQQQQQTDASSQQGSDATAGDPDATAAAAAAGMAAAAGLDASALAQQAAMFPGLQTLAQLQLLQNFGVTPDKARSRLPGGLLGPGTPDEVRMAHMGLQFTGSMRSCHCKKSQCLKLYCDCFANTTYCNGCACVDCKNVEANAQEVMAKRSQIQQRDPNAFTHKLAQRADTLTNRKGCKCKKSHCLKKYCECYQLGVRCGDLCKCNDCHNVGEIEGALPIPTAALLQHSALMSAASSGQQQRMQHAAAAAAGPYWPQLAQALPAVSAGAAAATPSTSVGMAQAQAQAQLLLRLQNSGQPGTPSSAPLAGSLALQSAAADGTAAEPGAAGGGSSGAATPLAAVASTPQPPKSAGRLSVDKSSLRSTAKPLLPEFMQAAAAAAGKEAGGSARQGMLLRTSAAADAAAAEDQLPTPDQAGAEQHLLQMRDTSSELEPGAAAAAATAEAVVAAAAAAAAAAHQQFDAAALAAMPLQHVDFAGQQLHGLYGSPMQDPSAKLQQQQQRSPARVRASASTSSGGDSRAGPVSSAVPGSVTSKGRHRLAASSRTCEDEASTGDMPQQQQQQQQHHALAALVSGAAAAAAGLAAGKPGGGQFSNARRQLLQQIQEEAAGVSDFSGGTSWPPEQQQQQGVDGYGTPAQTAAAAAGADGSPGEAIMLGPNGPMVVLPQHVLRSAMSQAAAAAALNLTAMPCADAAAADGSGEEQQAAAGVPRQTAGTLMTVTDAQGCVQFFFLPNTQAGVGAGAQQEPAADDPMQVDQSPAAAAAAAAADASRQQHCDQQQQQQQRMSTRHHPQPPLPPSQQQQQQGVFTTPTKSYPADEDDLAAAAGRSLRSSSAAAAGAAAAGGGGSSRSTPSKRTTPIKRKAEGEDATPGSSPQQFGPSPAKLPHHLGSPPGLLAQQAQVSPSQPVVLSPVKLAARALAASGGAPEGAFNSRRPQRSTSSSSRAAQPQQQQTPQQQPEMQLFLATTADGQQLLLQAPAGTDPESLIGADGSVQSCYLAAVLPSTPALASQQYLQQQQQLAAEQYVQQQQQQQQQQLLSPQQQQQQLSPSSRRPIKQPLQVSMPPGGGTFASPSKVMSASPGKLSSPSGLLRFSPGSKTVFSPKGSSPSKPLLGSSPGRV